MPSARSSMFVPVLDLRPPREGRVDGAVAVAGHVEGGLDLGLVELPVEVDDKCDVDLREGLRPFRLLLAFNLDREGFERLLELSEQEDGVETGAAAEGAEQHLGGSHRLVVAENRGLVDGRRVTRSGLDFEPGFVPRPASGGLLHDPYTVTPRRGE